MGKQATYSVGMDNSQSFFRIVLPQALRIAFPNIANSIIGSLKDTSLAFTIGVMDMMGRGETLILRNCTCSRSLSLISCYLLCSRAIV